MTVTFQVGDREFGSAGNLEVDFWVCGFVALRQTTELRKGQTIKMLTCVHSQVSTPNGQYEVNEKAVSNGDHSFEAKQDGKYIYCFGNEGWGASSKEVTFNVHGIVYVSESDAPQDPLESEGTFQFFSPLITF